MLIKTPLCPRPPGGAEEGGEGGPRQAEQASAGKERRDFHGLFFDHQLRVEVGIDRLEILLGLGVVVVAVGQRRNLLQRGLVELCVDVEPLDIQRRAGHTANADRMDTHPTVDRALHRRHWIGRRGIFTIAQQDNRGRAVRPRRHGGRFGGRPRGHVAVEPGTVVLTGVDGV